MTGRNTVKRHRGPGKPFVKGDSRINRNGQISHSVLAFNKTLRELIVTEGEAKHTSLVEVPGGQKVKVTHKKVEWVVKVLWNAAMKGEAWAVQFIAERTEGKVTQPVSGDMKVDSHLTVEFVETKG